MPVNMTTVDIDTNIAYNTRALIRCEASYLGASLPTKTTQPPGIIHEPLEKICEKENLPTLMGIPKKPVRMYVFHSGVIIELLFGKHNGELVWYPIQNLYCSAGILPFKTKNGQIEFRTLDDPTVTKSSLKPIFSMVFRETVRKKVLQCHAFAVARKELAQLLVQATAVAYRDKHGWNKPLSSSLFSNCEYNYTLNIVEDVHADSGYSDHEESSQKSSQSPQSSELSTEIDTKPTLDNQKSQVQKILLSTPSSSTASLATLRESACPQSPNLNHMYQRSPSNSAASVSFSDTQEGHSGDELHDGRSVKAMSISSGYPMSRDSSTIAPPTPREQIHPQMVVTQKPRVKAEYQRSKSNPPFLNNNNFHEINGKQSPISVQSFDSLSLEQSPKRKTDSKLRRLKTLTAVKPVHIDGIPRTLVQRYEPDFQPFRSRSYLSIDGSGQYYREPSYVAYHPEQFMYEGDQYVSNTSLADSSRNNEHYKTFQESKKKSAKASVLSNSKEMPGYTLTKVGNSMERRLTKKSIPRQLL